MARDARSSIAFLFAVSLALYVPICRCTASVALERLLSSSPMINITQCPSLPSVIGLGHAVFERSETPKSVQWAQAITQRWSALAGVRSDYSNVYSYAEIRSQISVSVEGAYYLRKTRMLPLKIGRSLTVLEISVSRFTARYRNGVTNSQNVYPTNLGHDAEESR